MSGRVRARTLSASTTARVSVAWARKNFRRAGVLKNNARTVTVVPRCRTASSTASRFPPTTRIRVPERPSGEVSSSKRATEAIAGSASPRKPNVATPIKSVASRILLVAWRDSATSAGPPILPPPLDPGAGGGWAQEPRACLGRAAGARGAIRRAAHRGPGARHPREGGDALPPLTQGESGAARGDQTEQDHHDPPPAAQHREPQDHPSGGPGQRPLGGGGKPGGEQPGRP